jgi:histone H3/H4
MVPKLNIERMWRRVSQERRVVTRAKETYKTTEAQNDVTLYEFQIVPYD